MEKKKSNSLWVIIVLIATVGLLGNTYLKYYLSQNQQNEVVALVIQDINTGQVITEKNVKLFEVPKDVKLENTATTIESVVGKQAKTDMYVGEQVILSKLTAQEDIDVTKVNYSYSLSPLDKALNIKPNDYVDVWAVPTSEHMATGLIPEKIFKGLKVKDIVSSSYETTVEAGAKEVQVPDYAIFSLHEDEITKIISLDLSKYSLKLTKYNGVPTSSEIDKDAVSPEDVVDIGIEPTEETVQPTEEEVRELQESLKESQESTSQNRG